MDGKEKCRYLRSVRKTIAEENNIDMEFEECTYEGECRGTCPKCDSELEFLNGELEKRKESGEKVVIPTDNNAETKSGFHPIARLKEFIEKFKEDDDYGGDEHYEPKKKFEFFARKFKTGIVPCDDESTMRLICVGESYGTTIYHSKEEIESVRNGPLAGLELSEMSLRLLIRSGKNTVKDVLKMDEEALSRLKELNENCYCELIYKVHFWELKFDYENNN
ncbi:MAG: hypothetical protein ACI4QZ_09555 [Eubacteriales bacterium]